MKPTIIFVVGSFRASSFNKQFAYLVQKELADKADIEYLYYFDVPWYIAEIEYPAPASIARIRETLKGASGIWFFTPEYNGLIPGCEKNLIDWLSRPIQKGGNWQDTSLHGMKATISSCAGRNAGKPAIASLTGLLQFCGCDVMTDPISAIAMDATAFADNVIQSGQDIEALAKTQAEAFLQFIQTQSV